MAKRRRPRRRRFRGTEAQHRATRDSSIAVAKVQIRVAEENAERGACKAAFYDLLEAQETVARASQEATWVKESGSPVSDQRQNLQRVTKLVFDRCVLKPAGAK